MPLSPTELKAFARVKAPYRKQEEGPVPQELEGVGQYEENGPGRFGAIIEMLEDASIELQDAVSELSEAALEELDVPLAELAPQDQDTIEDIYEELDDGLRAEMAKAFAGGITEDEAHELAEHLADEDMIDDEDAVGAIIYRLSEHVAKLPAESTEQATTELGKTG